MLGGAAQTAVSVQPMQFPSISYESASCVLGVQPICAWQGLCLPSIVTRQVVVEGLIYTSQPLRLLLRMLLFSAGVGTSVVRGSADAPAAVKCLKTGESTNILGMSLPK